MILVEITNQTRFMKYISVLLPVLFLLYSACGSENGAEMSSESEVEQKVHVQFFENISSLCGETFAGESTYPDDPDHALVDTELRAHISSCEEERIEVDFYRDDDTWHATWIVDKREDGLHLYHEHIGDNAYEDGEEPLTGYGGYADGRGQGFIQYFPADEHTTEILPEAATNVWSIEYVEEEDKLVYYLERHEEPRFKAELTRITD